MRACKYVHGYKSFFDKNYSLMKPFVGEEDTLLEIGCRDDRGVLSAQILDFSRMTILDMTPSRVSLTKNTSQQLNSPEKNQKINFIVADIFGEDIESIGS